MCSTAGHRVHCPGTRQVLAQLWVHQPLQSLGISPACWEHPDKRGGQQSALQSMWRGGKMKLDTEKSWYPPLNSPGSCGRFRDLSVYYKQEEGGKVKSTTSIFWHAGGVGSCISTALMDWWAAARSRQLPAYPPAASTLGRGHAWSQTSGAVANGSSLWHCSVAAEAEFMFKKYFTAEL